MLPSDFRFPILLKGETDTMYLDLYWNGVYRLSGGHSGVPVSEEIVIKALNSPENIMGVQMLNPGLHPPFLSSSLKGEDHGETKQIRLPL